VLLDLSDRIMDARQQQRDKDLLAAVFTRFEAMARERQYIYCQNRLQVLALPQKNNPPQLEALEQRLRLDFSKIHIKDRSNYLKKNGAVYTTAVDSMYALAGLGRRSSDYAGSDTWQFFRQYLPHYLSTDTLVQNRVIVITDGYLDFENLEHKKQEGCRYSFSSALMQDARSRGDRWRTVFDNGCGLLPVIFNQPNTQIMLLEMQPRNSFMYEKELLNYMWTGWTRQMNIGAVQFIQQPALEDGEKAVAGFLK
jgi:hypothetical protein